MPVLATCSHIMICVAVRAGIVVAGIIAQPATDNMYARARRRCRRPVDQSHQSTDARALFTSRSKVAGAWQRAVCTLSTMK